MSLEHWPARRTCRSAGWTVAVAGGCLITGVLVTGCSGAQLEDDPTADPLAEGGEAPAAFVFMSERTGQGDLYVTDISGSRLRQLTFSPAPDFSPRWADGTSTLYFLSDRRPEPGVYRMTLERDSAVFVQPNPAGDEAPRPSPDGQWIAYPATRNGNEDIYIS
ncbi:MAG: hypothetical protein M8840_10955, partial [marine benthic group bacterium]|nr:hypothetical protein [Gemmatimonadota bacterium]